MGRKPDGIYWETDVSTVNGLTRLPNLNLGDSSDSVNKRRDVREAKI